MLVDVFGSFGARYTENEAIGHYPPRVMICGGKSAQVAVIAAHYDAVVQERCAFVAIFLLAGLPAMRRWLFGIPWQGVGRCELIAVFRGDCAGFFHTSIETIAGALKHLATVDHLLGFMVRLSDFLHQTAFGHYTVYVDDLEFVAAIRLRALDFHN